jgi:hypothetical protein
MVLDFGLYWPLNKTWPITVGARSKARTVFARSNAGIVVSNPTQGMDVSVRLFCVLVAALQRADPPSKESYRLCIDQKNWKSGQGPTNGYRAKDRQTDRQTGKQIEQNVNCMNPCCVTPPPPPFRCDPWLNITRSESCQKLSQWNF